MNGFEASETKIISQENVPTCGITGFIVAPILALVWSFLSFFFGSCIKFNDWENFIVTIPCFFGSLSLAIFHICVCFPGYSSGKPGPSKFILLGLGSIFLVIGLVACLIIFWEKFSDSFFFNSMIGLIPLAFIIFSYFAFMGDDSSDSFMLVYKPWRFRKPLQAENI